MNLEAMDAIARAPDNHFRKSLALYCLGNSLETQDYVMLAVKYAMSPPLDMLDCAFLLQPALANYLALQLAEKHLDLAYLPNGNFIGFVLPESELAFL